MSTKQELDAILHRAAIAPLNDRAFLRVTGSDATRWLNGMVTNSVQALAPGEGCYNFLLNAQGRILGDCTIFRELNPAEPASFLLQTDNWQLETVRQHLDHFIIMDDVELTPTINDKTGMLVIGPGALATLDVLNAWPTPPVSISPARDIFGDPVIIDGNPLILSVAKNNYEFWGDQTTVDWIRSSGDPQVSPEALEAWRIFERRPLYGRDITEKYLPQETNQPQALHFNKGCYLGQEIVERIRSRGQVHRLLTPLTLTGKLPQELPTPIESDGKPVGEITSAVLVPLPDGDQILALGYVRREALDTHAALTYPGGTAAPRAASKELQTTTH
jgi:folate-binding protein YgfZ